MTHSFTGKIENDIDDKIANKMAQLKNNDLLRQRRLLPQNCIDFSNNDYLGLKDSRLLVEAMIEGTERFGVGSGASPLVSGYSYAHKALEEALCQQTGHQAAMIFSCGFSANHALISTLFSDNDKVIADKLIHASIIDGLKNSQANFKRFLHNDLVSAKQMLEQFKPCALITESVFSMDGDISPLQKLKELCNKHNTWMIVDDAHGFGCDYPLAKVTANLANIQIITFGKALGCQGAALLGTDDFINFMVANCRHYIYSTALSPAAAWTALEAIKSLTKDNQAQQRLTKNIALFKQLFSKYINGQYPVKLIESITGIQPVIIGNNQHTLTIAKMMLESGFLVGAIRPPTVPKGSARLRITINAAHTNEQISSLIQQLAITLTKLGIN